MVRLLFSPGSEIIAVGDPRSRIGPVRADYWLPCWLDVEDDKGSSFQVLSKEWQTYFDALAGWRWIATGDYGMYDSEPARYLTR